MFNNRNILTKNLYTVAPTELTIEEAVMAILARIYDYI